MNDPADLRDEATEILSGREFQDPRPSLADRAFGWVGDRLGDIFEGLFGSLPGGGYSFVAWLILIVVVGLLMLVLVRAIRGRGHRVASVTPRVVTEIGERQGSAFWFRLAQQAEASGDNVAAVRAYYRAGTARLIEEGRLPDEPGATAGRWERSIDQPSPQERDALSSATLAFERAWYGGKAPGTDDVRQIARESEQIGRR